MAADKAPVVGDSDDLDWLEQLGISGEDLEKVEEVDIAEVNPDIPPTEIMLDADPALQFALDLAGEVYALPRTPLPEFDEEEWQRWINADIPPDHISPEELLPMVMQTAGLQPMLDIDDDINGDSRVAAALHEIGLSAPDGLDLEADAFSLAPTSEDAQPMFLVSGIFSGQEGDEQQAMIVLLEEADDGERLQAMAVPFGASGNPELARENWETMRDTLYLEGPDKAFEMMQDVDAQQRSIQPDIEAFDEPELGVDIDL